jgi:hypothetical protein
MLRPLLHYGIHFAIPIVIGLLCFPKMRWKAVLILLLGIAIDLDHLLADPIFDSNRCSIGYHPLHSGIAILGYLSMLLFPKLRLIGLALILHIIADSTDCLLLNFGL